MVENDIFYNFVEERKQGRQKIRRKIFPSGPPFFILIFWEENMLKDTLYTNTLNLFVSPTPHFIHLNCDLVTFPSSSLSLYLHSTAISRFSSLSLSLSPSFYFIFPCLLSAATWLNQVDRFYCLLSSLYSSLIYCFLADHVFVVQLNY